MSSELAVNEQTRNETPEKIAADAEYGYMSGWHYKYRLDLFELPPKQTSVLEIGPGTAFGAMAYLSAYGAKVAVSDRWLATWQEDYHVPYYKAVADRIETSDPLADTSALRKMIENGKYEEGPIQLLPTDAENMEGLEDESLDIIFSNAVLEHVYDINAVAQTLFKITKPGGIGSHQIDFRDHRDFDKPREHLLLSTSEFERIADAANREPGSQLTAEEYAEAFEKAGFEIILYESTSSATDEYLNDFVPRLRMAKESKYSQLPLEKVRDMGGLFYVKRP